jgi:broad specificity phosphatase PhoE
MHNGCVIIKLVRHGESEANVADPAQPPAADHRVPLTLRGVEQARQAGRSLGSDFLQECLIYTSPFLRARQTLTAILEGAGLAPEAVTSWEDPRLREVDHGYSDVPSQHRMVAIHGHFYYRYHGGESPADCYDRVSGFLESFVRRVQKSQTRKALLVTHGLALRVFIMRMFRLTVEQFDAIANPHNGDIITVAPKETLQAPQFTSARWGVEGLRRYGSLSRSAGEGGG